MMPNNAELKVMFHFLIVRQEAFLERAYPGGFEAFASRFPCVRKEQLAAICAMNHQELEPIAEHLRNSGFDELDFFEGLWDGISGAFIAQDPALEQEVRLTEWLRGRLSQEGLLVRMSR